jgi:hypothetical protein
MQAARLFYRFPREFTAFHSNDVVRFVETGTREATARFNETATLSAFNRSNNLSRLQRNPHLRVMERYQRHRVAYPAATRPTV